MKRLKLLIICIMVILPLASCRNDSKTSQQSEKFLANISNDNRTKYIGSSSSYTEEGHEGAYYLNATLMIYSLDSSYVFKDTKIRCRGNIYYLPKDGNLTITYSTDTVKDKDATSYLYMKMSVGSFSITGKVYQIV